MIWLLNVPLMALFFLAMTVIPLRMVLKRPDTAAAEAERVLALRHAPTEPMQVPAELRVASPSVRVREDREMADIAA
jgi:DUF971 family protein